MIRFALKTAFALGVVTLFIPGLGSEDDEAVQVDIFKSVAGIQAAVEDVLGFCTRAPQACEAGSDLSAFALDRVESGLSVALEAAGPAVIGTGKPDDAPADTGPDQASPPRIDWSSIDPALIEELYAYDEAVRLGQRPQISAEMVKAVRQASKIAAITTSSTKAPTGPPDGETVFDDEAADGPATVPLPRARPAL